MTALGALLALLSAAVVGIVANQVARVGAATSSPASRYALWSVAFWSAPMAVMFTIAVAAMLEPHDPPALLRRAAGSVDRLAFGSAVAAALLVVATGALLRIMRLSVATLRASSLLRAARTRGAIVELPPDRRPEPRLRVFASDRVGVPLLVGLVRPAILIPEGLSRRLRPEQLAMIVEHEAVHARRRDNVRLWLEELAAALLWWSPAIGRARRSVRLHREISCDAAVLARAHADARMDYARTLLTVLGHAPGLTNAYARADASEMAHRLRSVMRAQEGRSRPLPLAASLLAVALLAAAIPVAGGGAIMLANASLGAVTPMAISFRSTGVVDPASGRRVFAVSFALMHPEDRLLAVAPRSRLAPMKIRGLGRRRLDLTIG